MQVGGSSASCTRRIGASLRGSGSGASCARGIRESLRSRL